MLFGGRASPHGAAGIEPDLVIASFFIFIHRTILILKEQYSKVVARWLKTVLSLGFFFRTNVHLACLRCFHFIRIRFLTCRCF